MRASFAGDAKHLACMSLLTTVSGGPRALWSNGRARRQLRLRKLLIRNVIYNPQNVPDPEVMPSPHFSPGEAVNAQLSALQKNDEPWPNHGVQTMYEFAEDAGGMERSRYFGYSKDLYHFDHFLGMFCTTFDSLVNLKEHRIIFEALNSDGSCSVTAAVTDASGEPAGVFLFRMVQHEFGRKRGCWMTKSLSRTGDNS